MYSRRLAEWIKGGGWWVTGVPHDHVSLGLVGGGSRGSVGVGAGVVVSVFDRLLPWSACVLLPVTVLDRAQRRRTRRLRLTGRLEGLSSDDSLDCEEVSSPEHSVSEEATLNGCSAVPSPSVAVPSLLEGSDGA